MSDHTHSLLDHIRFVLVQTTHSGNIGSVARALKTMGLSRIELNDPQCRVDADTFAHACGADDLIKHAGSHVDLGESLADAQLVIGASARLRSVEWPILTPHECAELALQQASEGIEVAILLGRESSGLTNEELSRCHYLVHIPANPDFSSLNVAAAAQVLAYELRHVWLETYAQDVPVVHDGDPETHPEDEHRVLATADEMESFYEHLVSMMADIGFRQPGQSRKLVMRLRRLFNRARLDRNEINILRGIFRASQDCAELAGQQHDGMKHKEQHRVE